MKQIITINSTHPTASSVSRFTHNTVDYSLFVSLIFSSKPVPQSFKLLSRTVHNMLCCGRWCHNSAFPSLRLFLPRSVLTRSVMIGSSPSSFRSREQYRYNTISVCLCLERLIPLKVFEYCTKASRQREHAASSAYFSPDHVSYGES